MHIDTGLCGSPPGSGSRSRVPDPHAAAAPWDSSALVERTILKSNWNGSAPVMWGEISHTPHAALKFNTRVRTRVVLTNSELNCAGGGAAMKRSALLFTRRRWSAWRAKPSEVTARQAQEERGRRRELPPCGTARVQRAVTMVRAGVRRRAAPAWQRSPPCPPQSPQSPQRPPFH